MPHTNSANAARPAEGVQYGYVHGQAGEARELDRQAGDIGRVQKVAKMKVRRQAALRHVDKPPF